MSEWKQSYEGEVHPDGPRWVRRSQQRPRRKGTGARPPFEKHGLADHIKIHKDQAMREKKRVAREESE